MLAFAKKLVDQFRINLEEINLGGGFGVTILLKINLFLSGFS